MAQAAERRTVPDPAFSAGPAVEGQPSRQEPPVATTAGAPEIAGPARAVRVLRALAGAPGGLLTTKAVVEALAVPGEPPWAEENRYRVTLYGCKAAGQVEIVAKVIYVGSGGQPKNMWHITATGRLALADRDTWMGRCLRLAATELLGGNGTVTGERLAPRTGDVWGQLVRIAVDYGRASRPPLHPEELEPLKTALVQSGTHPAALLRAAAEASPSASARSSGKPGGEPSSCS